MADPFSMLASALTLVGACTAISRRTVTFIRSLREAPEELIRLSNEISDFTTILNQIEKGLVRSNNELVPFDSAHTRVLPSSTASPTSQAELLIAEVDNFIGSLMRTSSKKGGKEVDRLGWARKRRTALHLQQRLAETKQSIQLQLSANTATNVRQIEVMLNNFRSSAEEDRKIYERKIDVMLEKFIRCECEDPKSSVAKSDSIAAIPLQENLFHLCTTDCDCICHLRSATWRRFPLLQSVIGVLSFHYIGLKSLQPACSSAQCSSFSSKTFKITFCLPRWLLMMAAHVLTVRSPFGPPTMALVLQRRTQEFAEGSIYHLAESGNLEGVRSAIMSRIATPTDAADSNGYTALHFAVRSDFIKASPATYLRRLQVSKLLMRYGARAELEDDHGVTAAQIAWERILKKEQEAQGFREIFPESQTLPLFNFSDVHKTVLSLLPIEIEGVLLKRKWQAQVDLRDAWGRTPLHWAILREDERATRVLITSGASIDIGDNEGNVPLHFAAGCPNIGCLNILLSCDANPRIKNASGAEPLHFASCQTIAHVQILIQVGASAAVLDNRGSSALEWACWCNKHLLGEYLIKMGADKNHADRLNGNSPLFSALTSQAYEFLEMLLAHNVNVLHINNMGSTVLHWTARSVDIRMLRIIQSRKFQFDKLDINARDRLGRTAKEVLIASGCTEEFTHEFVQFLEELESCQKAERRQIKKDINFQKAKCYLLSRTHCELTVIAAFVAGALLHTLPFHYSAILIVGILIWSISDTLDVHYRQRRRYIGFRK